MGHRSYHLSAGTSVFCYRANPPVTGIFGYWRDNNGSPAAPLPPCTLGTSTQRGISDILDGTSNTIAISEKALGDTKSRSVLGMGIQGLTGAQLEPPATGGAGNPTLCIAKATTPTNGTYLPGALATNAEGERWPMGHPYWGLFNTILPPNSPTCYGTGNDPSASNGVFPASSYHPGGVLGAMADGSVRFITEGIDCGSFGLAPSLSFGVWGAMGTIAGGESMGQGGTSAQQ